MRRKKLNEVEGKKEVGEKKEGGKGGKKEGRKEGSRRTEGEKEGRKLKEGRAILCSFLPSFSPPYLGSAHLGESGLRREGRKEGRKEQR